MCGIVGFIDRGPNAEKEMRLAKMMRSIEHRGPDDGRSWADTHCGLGFRRLAIIDVESGAQPLSNEEGNIWQVFNGEIYNYQDLREQLRSSGHRFGSQGDSEVIVHAYEQWGIECVSRLKGMFAFAVWDARNRELLLAVDRVGIKPLYYSQVGDALVFGSEAKALFASGLVDCEADYSTLPFHMTFLTSPFPRTMFKNVAKLPPGHYLHWKNGNVTIREYWDAVPNEDPSAWRDMPYQRIHNAVDSAVRRQSMADVPLGAFLSGGIDSSAVCKSLVDEVGPIETYFIGFRPEDLDADVLMNERPFARQMADLLKSVHHEIDLAPKGLDELLPKLVWHMDEPVGDPAAVTTYLVSQAARKTLTVLLSGVGGDEIFGGYPRYLAMKLMGQFHQLPRSARALATWMGHRIPGGTHAYLRGAKKFLRSAEGDELECYLRMLTYFAPEQHADLFTREFYNEFCQDDVYAYHREYAARVNDQPTLSRLQYVDFKTFLPCLNLTYTDRMSMAASIEVRVPFLDEDLVEAMTSLPVGLRIKGKCRKWGLKKSMEGHLPKDVIWRKKTGFGAPIQAWINGDLKPMVDELLSESALQSQGIFNPKAIQRLLKAEAGKEDYFANHIWQILTYQIWHQEFVTTKSRMAA